MCGEAAGNLRAISTCCRRCRQNGLGAGPPGDDSAIHPLAAVGDAYNAVFVESMSAGRLMFYGPGAGGSPTASAVLGDLVTVARNRLRGAVGPGESSYAARPVSEIGKVMTRYHLSPRGRRPRRCTGDHRSRFLRTQRVDRDRTPERARCRRTAGDRDPPCPRCRAQCDGASLAQARRCPRGHERHAR